jgi:hypothetical protein
LFGTTSVSVKSGGANFSHAQPIGRAALNEIRPESPRRSEFDLERFLGRSRRFGSNSPRDPISDFRGDPGRISGIAAAAPVARDALPSPTFEAPRVAFATLWKSPRIAPNRPAREDPNEPYP